MYDSLTARATDNPGMCWPEYHTVTTPPFNASSHAYTPIRVRYQSGCGGGHVEVRVCEGGACHLLFSTNVTSSPTRAMPVFVNDDAILVSSGAEMFSRSSPQEAPYDHVVLPTDVPSSTNTSTDLIMSLDPFLLNSGVHVVLQAGLLAFSLNQTTLPPGLSPYIQLNTSFFKHLLPSLYDKFPDDAMTLDIAPVSYVPLSINPTQDSLAAGMSFQMNVSVLQGRTSQSLSPFSLFLDLFLSPKVQYLPFS